MSNVVFCFAAKRIIANQKIAEEILNFYYNIFKEYLSNSVFNLFMLNYV